MAFLAPTFIQKLQIIVGNRDFKEILYKVSRTYNILLTRIMQSATGVADTLSSSTSASLCRRFTLAEIQSATNDFDDELVIGQGGFGKVYKSRISIGHVLAIKRLDCMSNQGASEFRAEIEMLSKLRHCHLVPLIGYCDDDKEMILVYEYMPNGTLYDHLHKEATPLTWVQRLKMAIGAGSGLDYLHTCFGTRQGVIHRDIKSSNILLNENWEAMLSDFGLSKIGPVNQSFVDASVKGTFGYLDPEYFYTRKLTVKTDVYAFGVVLFELLSGRLAVDERQEEEQCSLVRWSQKCVKQRKYDQMVDPTIRGTISSKCLKQFAQIAYRCLLSVPKERSSMSEVVGSLQALLEIQENLDINDSSLSVMGFTWKINKYLVSATKQNTGDTSSMKCEPSTDDDYSDIDRDLRIFTLGELKPGTMIHGSVHLTMNQVARATQNFAPSLRIGEGGFGTVYKAQLPDGQVVAIKRLKKYELNFDALRSEVVFGRFCHRNLVESLGYVDDGMERVIIKEYVPNGTLREHLDGVHGSFLDFSQRLEICIDISHGLTYLHLWAGDQIIHGGVKSSHILLTERMRAKVVDFGFARFGDKETDETHVATKVIRGTGGYLDPVYTRTYKLTPKSDVYSFGVLLIEILTGRCPIESQRSPEENVTIRWAFGKYNDGDIMDLVDPQMKEAVGSEIFTKMLALAFRCAAPNPVDRPEMKAVAEQLWAISDHLRQGRNG